MPAHHFTLAGLRSLVHCMGAGQLHLAIETGCEYRKRGADWLAATACYTSPKVRYCAYVLYVQLWDISYGLLASRISMPRGTETRMGNPNVGLLYTFHSGSRHHNGFLDSEPYNTCVTLMAV